MRATPFYLMLLLVGSFAGAQDEQRTARRSGSERPACSREAICFSGEVARGQEFRKALARNLQFVLEPSQPHIHPAFAYRGWKVRIVPKQAEGNCREFAGVVNAPYRQHNQLYIDVSYGWAAEQEVSDSPREFRFVTNCADWRTEAERLDIVLWPYTATRQQYDEALAKLGSSPLGRGRLWITSAKTSHAADTAEDKLGSIEWMKFAAEIVLPR